MYKKVLFCVLVFSSTKILSMTDAVKQHNAAELKPVIEHAKLLVQEKGMGGVPKILAIAGCSAIGKTFLTHELADLLKSEGIRVAILHADHFINPDQNDPDHFHPRFDHKRVHAVLQGILDGKKSVRKPTWNPLGYPLKIEEDFSVEGIDLILFEGEFTLCDDESYDFKRYFEFGIFIDANPDDISRWDWIKSRDEVVEKTQEELTLHRRPSHERYRAFVRSARDSAAYLLWKDSDHRYTLHKNKIFKRLLGSLGKQLPRAHSSKSKRRP